MSFLSCGQKKLTVAPLAKRATLATNAGEDGHALYKKLIEDVFASQMMGNFMINTLNTATNLAAFKPTVVSNKPVKVTVSKIESHNPFYALIHHTLLPVRGSYPSDYLARHTSKDMLVTARYPGNLDDTYKLYHLLSNRHIAPPGLILNAGRPMRAMPTTRPTDIESIMRERMQPIDNIKSIVRDRMKPLSRAPGLLPLVGDEEVAPDFIQDEDRVPELLAFGDLIGCHGSGSDSGDDSFLSPVTSAMRDRMESIAFHNNESEEDDDEFAHLPSVKDVFA